MATFISNPSTRETVMFQMREWLADGAVKNIPSVRLLGATMCVMSDNVTEAIKLLGTTNLEQ